MLSENKVFVAFTKSISSNTTNNNPLMQMHEEANENAEGLEVFSCLLQETSIWDILVVFTTYSQ